MPAPEHGSVRPALPRHPAGPQRRIRHEARDGLAVAGLSLLGSVAVTALFWAALRWAG